eukprot:SAG11_NODE_545_length_8621_cov_25.321521_1_plen_59_part_00
MWSGAKLKIEKGENGSEWLDATSANKNVVGIDVLLTRGLVYQPTHSGVPPCSSQGPLS